MKNSINGELPTSAQLEAELNRVKYQRRYGSTLRSTIYALITVSAVAILIATLWLPVLRIYGTSMSPTLTDGEIVCSVKTSHYRQGDLIAFYYNNRILVKRVIGSPGDCVDLDENGNVYVNGMLLEEPYVLEKALGECNITLPCQVPDTRVFVIGDHRSTSIDSRHTSIGCVAEEQIIGRILFRVWPLNRLGVVK